MLRFDPGDEQIHTARSFRVWEGGGEYNVARNLAKCFRLDTAVVTALADNQIGWLVEDLISQGRVDTSEILWRETDGISAAVRNGVYFMERGFGSRAPAGCSDRANTAVSRLRSGDIDWAAIFGEKGVRWFHTGGIFVALSETTAQVAADAMRSAKENGSIVSYDLNYRESLWSARGGREAANQVNRQLLEHADLVFGVEGFDPALSAYAEDKFRNAGEKMRASYPGLKVVATTLRDIHSASRHSLSAVCLADEQVFKAGDRVNADVLDRVGSGDAFAAGLIYGCLNEKPFTESIEFGVTAAVLSLASPGDGLSARLEEVERGIKRSDNAAIR